MMPVRGTLLQRWRGPIGSITHLSNIALECYIMSPRGEGVSQRGNTIPRIGHHKKNNRRTAVLLNKSCMMRVIACLRANPWVSHSIERNLVDRGLMEASGSIVVGLAPEARNNFDEPTKDVIAS